MQCGDARLEMRESLVSHGATHGPGESSSIGPPLSRASKEVQELLLTFSVRPEPPVCTPLPQSSLLPQHPAPTATPATTFPFQLPVPIAPAVYSFNVPQLIVSRCPDSVARCRLMGLQTPQALENVCCLKEKAVHNLRPATNSLVLKVGLGWAGLARAAGRFSGELDHPLRPNRGSGRHSARLIVRRPEAAEGGGFPEGSSADCNLRCSGAARAPAEDVLAKRNVQFSLLKCSENGC